MDKTHTHSVKVRDLTEIIGQQAGSLYAITKYNAHVTD